MGKGQIISGGEGGLYQVKIIFSRARIERTITILTEQIALYDVQIDKAQADISILDWQIIGLDAEIAILAENPRQNAASLKTKNDERTAKITERYKLWRQLGTLKNCSGRLQAAEGLSGGEHAGGSDRLGMVRRPY